MPLTRVRLSRFTAFNDLDMELPPGFNVLVGANGTGKTHLMKVCYAACAVSGTGTPYADKLVRVFLPSGRALGRLVKRQRRSSRGEIDVFREDRSLKISFSSHTKSAQSARTAGAKRWADSPMKGVYIPAKEMLSSAPGFRSLYAAREVHFEEVYADILDRAYLPLLRGPADPSRRRLLAALEKVIDGKVTIC